MYEKAKQKWKGGERIPRETSCNLFVLGSFVYAFISVVDLYWQCSNCDVLFIRIYKKLWHSHIKEIQSPLLSWLI